MTNTNFSKIAAGLGGLSIASLAEKVNERIKNGEKIYNFTIGDFDSKYFSIPQGLENEIIRAYQEKHTNYPRASGVEPLLQAIVKHMERLGHYHYQEDEVIIASGARPIIYTVFNTVVDPGDKVIYPAPSWNNYNYAALTRAESIIIDTHQENDFLLTAKDIKPHISDAVLIALNSPLNPAGSAFAKDELKAILDLVVAENKRREGKKSLYVMFDMIYWQLTYGDTEHYNPIALCPEARDYMILVDGVSKCFAATGVRVGWGLGPKPIIAKMRMMLSHIGAWPPKPEQIAVARFLLNFSQVDDYISDFKNRLYKRLNIFYTKLCELQQQFGKDKIMVLKPQATFYLTVKLNLFSMSTAEGKVLKTVDEINSYLLDEAKVAVVPFYAFGAAADLPWFRIAVASCSDDEIELGARSIVEALKKLSAIQV